MPDILLEDQLRDETSDMLALETQVKNMEAELSQNEQFQNFIRFKKEVDERSAAFFDELKKRMNENQIKSIKGDWGSITVVERMGFDIDESALPPKYFKKVVDTKKIGDIYKLENKLPKGATAKVTNYLLKKFK